MGRGRGDCMICRVAAIQCEQQKRRRKLEITISPKIGYDIFHRTGVRGYGETRTNDSNYEPKKEKV